MTRLVALTLAVLMLAGCDSKPTTTVVSSTSVNGVVTTNKLNLTNYAMRAALGNNPNSAAYVTIKNDGDQPDRLISATCECATVVSLHTMKMNGSVMEMAEMKDGFPIAAGETVAFVPGGNHIMLEGLKVRPTEGSNVNVKLTFEKAGDVTLSMPVSNAPLAKSGAADEHAGMKM